MGIRIERSLLEALDACAAAEPDTPGRPEVIRRILTEDLTRRGFLQEPLTDADGEVRELTAEDMKRFRPFGEVHPEKKPR